jgi:hypothetical protein
MAALSALATLPDRKCRGKNEWQQCESCTAATGGLFNGW